MKKQIMGRAGDPRLSAGAEQKKSLAGQFGAAADALATPRSTDIPGPRIQNLLESLGCWPAPADASRRHHLVRMLSFAARLDRFFQLDSPFAPLARFCGGMDRRTDFRPAGSYAGRGIERGRAFLTCIGEAAEYSAMYRRTDDLRIKGEAIAGQSLVSGKTVKGSASVVLRAQDSNAHQPSSTGYAAGPTFAAAAESAFLECVERDAIARWSLGETRPVRIKIDEPLQALLNSIGRTPARPVLFADISPANALARSVTAVSTDKVIGTAFGFGSAFSKYDACRKALLELCQGEIGLLMIARKRQQAGDGSLVPKEKEALARSGTYQLGGGLLDFLEISGASATSPEDFATAAALADARGVDILAFDITVPGEDIPVAKVFVDGLFDAATLPGQNGFPPLL